MCAGTAIGSLLQEDSERARHGVYFGDATARIKREWWFHRAAHLWFLIERDTATDQIIEITLASRMRDADGV